MAKIRTIKPQFWENFGVSRLSLPARLLYIGMWNFADDLGVIIAVPIGLKSKIFPYEDITPVQLQEWLDELIRYDYIQPVSYEGNRFYYITSFTKHQLINRPNLVDVNIPSEVIKAFIKANNSETLSRQCSNTVATVPIKDSIVKERILKESIGKDSIVMDSKVYEEKERILSFSPRAGENEKHYFEEDDFEKFNDWIKENTPFVAKMMVQISEKEFDRLRKKYTCREVMEILTQMDNYKSILNKYTNVYRTFLNWAKKSYG